LQTVWENGRSQEDNFGRIGNDIAREFNVFGLSISPSVDYPVVAPWTLVWPEVDWYLLDLKREEKRKGDLLSAFEYRVMKLNSEYTIIYTDGAKKPETGMTGFGVANI